MESQLDAREAVWNADSGRWDFFSGVERTFAKGSVRETAFTKMESDLTVPPRSLIPRTRNPDEMSSRETRAYAERMAHLGVSARELRVAAYTKVAYPFTNIVICALGTPVALRLRRAGKVSALFAALLVSFCLPMGHRGRPGPGQQRAASARRRRLVGQPAVRRPVDLDAAPPEI